MWMSSNNSWKVPNTKTVEMTCNHCGNTSENYVMAELAGISLGFIFMPARTRIGFRRYYLVCNVCNKVNKRLSINEVQHLKT